MASLVAAVTFAISVSVVSPISGAPRCMLATPAPVKIAASKPSSSITRANIALAAPGSVVPRRAASSVLSRVVVRINCAPSSEMQFPY